MQYSGVVSNVSSFPYMNKELWSFQLSGDRTYFRVGEKKPRIEKGQFVTFNGEPGKQGSVNVDSKTIVAKDASAEQASSGAGTLGAGNKANFAHPTGVSKDDYWAGREARDVLVQKRIERQSCRNSALELISVLVATGSVTFAEKAKPKDKVAILEAMVAHYTEKFIEDNDGKKETSNEDIVEHAAGSAKGVGDDYS